MNIANNSTVHCSVGNKKAMLLKLMKTYTSSFIISGQCVIQHQTARCDKFYHNSVGQRITTLVKIHGLPSDLMKYCDNTSFKMLLNTTYPF